jgi:light-regulated signal transduction histidine kinase (bacteriophytochrome)
LLATRYRGKLDPDADEFVDYITRGVRRMSDLIQDLLAYSHVVNPEGMPLGPVDMEGTLQWARMNLELAIRESGAMVTHGKLPTVYGNQVQLVQLLQNLMSNAIKYRSETGPHIHVEAQSTDSHWIFSVKDNGIGIDPQYHGRIFGVFKRLHGKDIPGTGIGLAICKKIVEKHEGEIWLESEPGKGSTFFFSIPV